MPGNDATNMASANCTALQWNMFEAFVDKSYPEEKDSEDEKTFIEQAVVSAEDRLFSEDNKLWLLVLRDHLTDECKILGRQ
jgi:hypothetical protein